MLGCLAWIPGSFPSFGNALSAPKVPDGALSLIFQEDKQDNRKTLFKNPRSSKKSLQQKEIAPHSSDYEKKRPADWKVLFSKMGLRPVSLDWDLPSLSSNK